MDLRKLGLIFGIGITAVLLVVLLTPPSSETTNGYENSLTYYGQACVKTRLSGVWYDKGCYKNLITTLGKNMIVANLNGSWTGNSQAQLTRLALGYNTSAQVVGDTALNGIYSTCGLGIATGSIYSQGNGNYSIVYEWTASSDSCSVNATGIYNTTQPQTLFAETTFPNVVLNTNDKLNINYSWWVSSS